MVNPDLPPLPAVGWATGRILVTGPRTLTHYEVVTLTLNTVEQAATITPLTLVHGAAAGLDTAAAAYAAARPHLWCVEPYPVTRADWARHGPGAGHRRNHSMVESGADLCIAYLTECVRPDCPRRRPHHTHGTTHAAAAAAAANIRIWRIPIPADPGSGLLW